jgi:electron transfer flavoprotein alpha subunit
MQDSNYIIAINKDADAPIMKAADVALVGDFQKIVPEMVAQLKAMEK